MEVKVLGRIRKLLEGIDAEPLGANDEQIALTPQLEQLVAMGAAPYREITRMGRAFYVHSTTAVAAVVAIPTTGCNMAIYNNDVDGGRSLVIDWVGATNVVSTAVASQAQLIGLVGQVRESAPADAAHIMMKANGFGSQGLDTKARTIAGATGLPANTGVAAGWVPIGPSVGKPGVAGTPGYGLWQAVDGRFIVPPGRYFALNVLANVVGETWLTSIGWHEALLALG